MRVTGDKSGFAVIIMSGLAHGPIIMLLSSLNLHLLIFHLEIRHPVRTKMNTSSSSFHRRFTLMLAPVGVVSSWNYALESWLSVKKTRNHCASVLLPLAPPAGVAVLISSARMRLKYILPLITKEVKFLHCRGLHAQRDPLSQRTCWSNHPGGVLDGVTEPSRGCPRDIPARMSLGMSLR